MKLASALAFAAAAAGALVEDRSSIDINQKVYIENAPVLGDGAGDAILGKCQDFAAQHVNNPDAPEVKVCGTGIKAEVFMRNRCEAYYEHQVTVGQCDKGEASQTCVSFSPANAATFGAYQSYLVSEC